MSHESQSEASHTTNMQSVCWHLFVLSWSSDQCVSQFLVNKDLTNIISMLARPESKDHRIGQILADQDMTNLLNNDQPVS